MAKNKYENLEKELQIDKNEDDEPAFPVLTREEINKIVESNIGKFKNADDNEFVNKVLRLSVEKGMSILAVLENEMLNEPSPRNAEVTSLVLQQIISAVTQIKEGKIKEDKNVLRAKEIEVKKDKLNALGGITATQNNIFVGSFKDLVKMAKDKIDEISTDVIDVKTVETKVENGVNEQK